jgi:hypothetical protein
LTAFSQSATDTSKITIPYPFAKQIALDLNSWDSLKHSYEVTMNILNMTEKKSVCKDSMISGFENKVSIYKQQIVLFENKEQYYIKYNDALKTDLIKQKAKTKLAAGIGAVVTIATSFIILGVSH